MSSPIPGLDRVGLLGGGVIGGGWAARFVLNGVDVDLYDPDPEAAARSARCSKTPAGIRSLTAAPRHGGPR